MLKFQEFIRTYHNDSEEVWNKLNVKLSSLISQVECRRMRMRINDRQSRINGNGQGKAPKITQGAVGERREEDSSSKQNQISQPQTVVLQAHGQLIGHSVLFKKNNVRFQQRERMPDVMSIIKDQNLDHESSRYFRIVNEDHTMGTLLTYILDQMPETEFCAYTIKHPTENVLYLRLKVKHGFDVTEVFKKGIIELKKALDFVEEKFVEAVDAYERNKS